jgi:predicted ABC-type ATPase
LSHLPVCYIIGGPNGIGKSTFAEDFSTLKRVDRIDPDKIFANEFTNPDKEAFPYFLTLRVAEYVERGEDFLFETNLHTVESYWIASYLKRYQYRSNLVFISTDDTNILVSRVKERALLGLHNVPEKVIIERYESIHEILPTSLTLFDKIDFYDGSPEAPGLMHYLGYYQKQLFVINEDIEQRPKWFERIIGT